MAAVGLLILVAAGVAGLIIALANSGSDHLVTGFSILGAEMDVSSGRVFLYGAIAGAVAMLGLNMLLAGMGRGLRNRARTRRTIKEERSRAGELEAEREQLRKELAAERSAHGDAQSEVDLRERSRTNPFSRHSR